MSVEFKNRAAVLAGFEKAPREMKRALRKSAAETARQVRGTVRSAAASGTPQQARMARGIGSSANSTSAIITVKNTRSAPGALGSLYGSKRFRQFPAWVGNSWKPLTRGEGPAHSRWLAPRKHEIEQRFVDGQLAALDQALPR